MIAAGAGALPSSVRTVSLRTTSLRSPLCLPGTLPPLSSMSTVWRRPGIIRIYPRRRRCLRSSTLMETHWVLLWRAHDLQNSRQCPLLAARRCWPVEVKKGPRRKKKAPRAAEPIQKAIHRVSIMIYSPYRAASVFFSAEHLCFRCMHLVCFCSFWDPHHVQRHGCTGLVQDRLKSACTLSLVCGAIGRLCFCSFACRVCLF